MERTNQMMEQLIRATCDDPTTWEQQLPLIELAYNNATSKTTRMASRVLVSGLPRSLPPLPPGPVPTCVPCVEGRQRAAPHSSEFPPTEAPLQTLHMDVCLSLLTPRRATAGSCVPCVHPCPGPPSPPSLAPSGLCSCALRCRLDYAAGLVAESASVCPPSVGGECALSTDVLEDRQEEFQCFAAALPHLVSTLLAPEGDPDAPDIPTPRSYAEAIEGPYSSQWQAAMDAEMAFWKSTGTYGEAAAGFSACLQGALLNSSCEAEIYAGAIAAQELRWLTYLLTDLGEQPRSPPVLYVDNKAMLALCREHRLEQRTKHIALRYFLARELQQRGQMRLAYVASEANTADIFTKALAPGDHQRFCTLLGLVPTWPHLLTS
ncbi:unnamed protein product [Closterium sp. NIES-53]